MKYPIDYFYGLSIQAIGYVNIKYIGITQISKLLSFIDYLKVTFSSTDDIYADYTLLITFPDTNNFKPSWNCVIKGLEMTYKCKFISKYEILITTPCSTVIPKGTEINMFINHGYKPNMPIGDVKLTIAKGTDVKNLGSYYLDIKNQPP